MSVSAIVTEAWRNLVVDTSRAAVLAGALVLGVGGLAVFDVRAVVGIIAGAGEFRDAGASVQVLDAPGLIDGARCDALAQVAGVRAAGAIRVAAPIRALSLPAAEISVYESTVGMGEVLGVKHAVTEGGVLLSDALSESLGVTTGDALTTSVGDFVVAGVYRYPDDGRARTLGYAVVTPVAATGAFDACWAEVWPTDAIVASYVRTALEPGAASSEANLAHGQLNATLGESYDAVALLAERPTRHVPLTAAALGGALGYAAIRARRLEIAGALHARVSRTAVGWQILIETLAWVVAATVVTAIGLWWFATVGNPDPGIETWLTGAGTVVAGGSGALAGAQLAVLATREKHLFRYFKDR